MDKKANKILLSTFWKNGWIDRKDRVLTGPDVEYAKSKGLMFDPISISHDDCVASIVRLVNETPVEAVAKGFVSSLSRRRLDWRSALSSYVIARSIPDHHYTAVVSGTHYVDGKPAAHSYFCGICEGCRYGVIGHEFYKESDLNVLNFERMKWGGVRHGDILYTLFDLREFKRCEIPEPTTDDVDCLNGILSVIESSLPDDYPGALEERLASVVKSSKAERQVIIEILASIGVLKPGSYDRPVRGRNDWVLAEYWRGEDGYCRQAVEEYFGPYLSL